MFGRFFKNKEDGKGGPPVHQRQGGPNGSADEHPVGGGFFNLPPPASKPYGGQNAAGLSVPSTSVCGEGPSLGGGYPPQPAYGSANAPVDNNSINGGGPSGGGMDMFGGMSVKAPPAATGNNGKGRYKSPIQQQQYGGGYAGTPQPIATTMQPPKANGSLFSGLEVAAVPAAHDDGGNQTMLTYASEQRRSSKSLGSFNYLDVAGSKTTDTLNTSEYSRTSVTSSTGTATSRSSSKGVKKKKKKTFRPGFGRQLSDESAAALQRGDLKEDDIIHQREGRIMSDRSDSSRSSRSVSGPTDLAHLLPPVKSGSVLQGLTVHKGSVPSGGGGVLAGLTVHKSASPSPSPAKVVRRAESDSDGNGVLSGLSIHMAPSIADDDVYESVNDTPVATPAPEMYKEPYSLVPAAPPTPEERLFNTLRDFHESAVSFRQFTVKQNEEENRLMERKAQLAYQLTQYEMDLRDVEAQQHHACEVEDFEKADALNATINSVRHCITLTESDVRKLDSELVAFVKTKEKAFANQLRSTRGTLRELEKFREDQESERTVARNEYKLYEANQTEQLQFEAERIDAEMHHVSVSLENVISEKSEIEATIEGQCSSEFAVQAQLIEEKQAVEEEVRELERRLKEKQDRVRKIQTSIDTAQRDINTVRKRYSRQLKRIADREDGIKKTKAEVESDGKHLEQQRHEFEDKLKRYVEDISIIGKRIGAVKKEMRAASLLANVLEAQETRREQSLIRKKQQTAELSSLNDATAVAEQSFTMLSKQHEELEKSLSIHRNAIASAEAMIPRLEQEKKTAAAQRNFKEAARISKDIKALEKDRSTAEEMVEVVELELQDLEERIHKRNVEFKEKKKELKEMEKHLDLATLQELWKEAKHLRTALRKIKKCKSEGDAANGGINFRSSAILLVQAEYDACILQVGTLEKKYDVVGPIEDEEDEDDDDDDESIDDEKESREHVSLSRSSLAGKTTDMERSNVDIDATEDSSSVLEEITAQLLELESQIEKATDSEEYELAARIDERIETLKQRQQTIEASMPQEAFDDVRENESSEDAVEESNSSEYFAEEEAEADEEYAHEEMVSPVNVGRRHDELTQSLKKRIQLGVVMPVEQTNKDYDTATSYDEELQPLQEKEKPIRAQDDLSVESSGVTAPTMFEGPDSESENFISIEAAVSGGSLSSPQEAFVESTTSGSLFKGLPMSNGPDVASQSLMEVPTTDPDLKMEDEAHEHEEVAAIAKFEIVSPTSSEMNDSFFGKSEMLKNSASLVTPSASGSLFGALHMSGSFQVDTASFASPGKDTEERKEDPDVPATEIVDLSASTSVGNGSMFSGLHLSSSAVNVGAGARTEPTAVSNENSADMFSGLNLSSSSAGAASLEHASTDASTDIFGGLELSSSAAGASSETSADMLGSLSLSSSAVAAAPIETDTDVAASSMGETDSSAKSVGDARMSIHKLVVHSENNDVAGANHDASFQSDVPSVTSVSMLSETSGTEPTTLSTTTVTKVLGDDDTTLMEKEQVTTETEQVTTETKQVATETEQVATES
ncbi:hypothetical protein DD238_006751 [Peronospora effusa]|uniref:UVR domain-containing protein n=1 Tax=Peronospora effusa TaxID=542832 RepID=A0A3M6VHI9_9STRA|nr:hypothetical protein DD238_006751 [Peronospora effusa]